MERRVAHAREHLIAHSHVEINLTELQKTLDAQGLEIVENQKESVVGRKGLTDKTKGVRTRYCLQLLNCV